MKHLLSRRRRATRNQEAAHGATQRGEPELAAEYYAEARDLDRQAARMARRSSAAPLLLILLIPVLSWAGEPKSYPQDQQRWICETAERMAAKEIYCKQDETISCVPDGGRCACSCLKTSGGVPVDEPATDKSRPG